MAKVTSKLQITLPKALATQYGIEPGNEIRFEGVSGAIRLIPAKSSLPRLSREERLRLFTESSQRLERRQQWLRQYIAAPPHDQHGTDRQDTSKDPHGRGWTRESLYDREVFKRYEIDDTPSEDASVDNGRDKPGS
jgi:bifunctional DNA-binding transcriptional regulator/antitoxin component of YhaV-PrlF toxin-antitoxin module